MPARHPGRWVGSGIALVCLALVVQSVATNPRWGWPVFAEWFFAPPVLEGLGLTLLLTGLSAVLGFVLGTALALARTSRSPLLAALAFAYTWLFRSVPVLVLLLLVNNLGYLYETLTLGLPGTDWVLWSVPTAQFISPMAAAVIGLTLSQSAYAAEIIRGGLLSVDAGQHEAASALGLPRAHQALRIVLPQAMRAILPAAFNDLIGLAKASSMVYILALPDLFYTIQIIYRRNLEVIPLLMVATVWYLVILTVLTLLQREIEVHYARGALRVVRPSLFTRAAALWRRGPRGRKGPGRPDRAEGMAGATSESGQGLTVGFRQEPTPDAGQGACADVQVLGLGKRYGASWVLRDVDLLFPAGSVTAIIGPSGSGKSTLLRCINHLERPDAGLVLVDGEPWAYERRGSSLRERSDAALLRQRADVGMVFQHFHLFSHLTVLDNVMQGPRHVRGLAPDTARALALQLLERVGLADRAHDYPRQLSGGQQQRVAIARALALRPRVLLFDEPTSALDPELVGEVLDVIRELARSGTTLVIVTHEMAFAREVADRVVFMAQGRVVESGAPAQVFGAPREARTAEFLAKVR